MVVSSGTLAVLLAFKLPQGGGVIGNAPVHSLPKLTTMRFNMIRIGSLLPSNLKQNPSNRPQTSAQEDHVIPTRLVAGVAGKTASFERSQ